MTPSEHSKQRGREGSLIEDMSHGPSIMLAISTEVGYAYVDGSRADSEAGAGIEVGRSDGAALEFARPEEVDALIAALRVARQEIWPRGVS